MRRRALLASLAAGTAGCGGLGPSASDDQPTVAPDLAGTPTPSDAIDWGRELPNPRRVRTVGERLVVQQSADPGVRLRLLNPADGTQLWSADVSRDSFTQLAGDRLLVSSFDNEPSVTAFEAERGTRLWETPGVLGFRGVTADVAFTRQMNSTVTTGLIATDVQTGERLWNREDLLVGFGVAADTYLYAQRRDDGVRLLGADPPSGTIRWRLDGPDPNSSIRLSVGGSTGVFAGTGGELIGARLTDGTETFRETVDSSFATTGVVTTDDALVYGDRRLYGETSSPARLMRVDPTDGVAWTTTLDGETVEPFTGGSGLYGRIDREAVVSIDTASGSVNWRRPEPVVARDERGPYTVADGQLKAISPSGAVRWRVSLPTDAAPDGLAVFSDPPETNILAIDGSVVVTSSQGVVSYDAADGSVRKTVSALSGVPESFDFLNGRLFYATGERLFGISV